VGTFASCVRDAFRILRAAGLVDDLAGELAGAGETAGADALPPDPLEARLDRPPRFGLLDGMFVEACDAEMRAIFARAIDSLRAAGAEIVALRAPPDLPAAIQNHRAIMARDAAHTHRAAFAAHAEAFGPSVAGLIREGLAVADADYQAALAHQRAWGPAVEQYFGGVDALLTPATPATAPASLLTTGDPRFNSPWSYAGLPAIALPCCLDSRGMPAGLQVVGPRNAELRLARAAQWIEGVIAFRQRAPLLRTP
jgi:Asp-tRNA(Asn)/Glu-tRNA(Gln) amidotransferase A subunit family amidase